MKQKIIPIVSVIIGLLAFILTSQYFNGKMRDIERERARLMAGTKKVSVMAPVRDIPKGTIITASDIAPNQIPESAASDRFVFLTDGPQILGKKTLFSLSTGKPILWSDIEGGAPPAQGLSSIVQSGMRAVSVPVSGPASVTGMVEPNDRVDVLGTFSFPSKTVAGEMESVTLTVLQDVTILAVGQTMAKQISLRNRLSAKPAGYSAVTLEVTPREAELMVFAQQLQGKLTLSLRNPADGTFERDLPEINFKYLESKLPEMNQYRQQKIRRKPGM